MTIFMDAIWKQPRCGVACYVYLTLSFSGGAGIRCLHGNFFYVLAKKILLWGHYGSVICKEPWK